MKKPKGPRFFVRVLVYNSNINLELNETLMASETGELFNDLPDGGTRIESVQPVKGPARENIRVRKH